MKCSRIHDPFYKPNPKSEELVWWHQIQLPEGTTPGIDVSDFRWNHMKHMIPDLKGKSVLDIGAWDGYFSFKAESLGASRVLAVDHFCWSGAGWGSKAGFDYAKNALGSKVESLDIDVPDIMPETVGMFDVIFMFGVLYHLPSILTSVANIALCAKEVFIIETLEDLTIQQDIPLLRFYPFDECFGDPTNWFVPNPLAVIGMLKCSGFNDVKEGHYSVGEYKRGIFRGSNRQLNQVGHT